jgi:hypothetical protein
MAAGILVSLEPVYVSHVHQLKGSKTHHNRNNIRCNTRKNEKQQAADSLTYIIRPPEDG